MRECLECKILIDEEDRFCKACGAFQRVSGHGRRQPDPRRAPRPYQTQPVEAKDILKERTLGDWHARQLSRFCMVGIILSAAGIFSAALGQWYGFLYGLLGIGIGSTAAWYRIELADTCLVLGILSTILSVSLPFT